MIPLHEQIVDCACDDKNERESAHTYNEADFYDLSLDITSASATLTDQRKKTLLGSEIILTRGKLEKKK